MANKVRNWADVQKQITSRIVGVVRTDRNTAGKCHSAAMIDRLIRVTGILHLFEDGQISQRTTPGLGWNPIALDYYSIKRDVRRPAPGSLTARMPASLLLPLAGGV
jgi:hypothetical protein